MLVSVDRERKARSKSAKFMSKIREKKCQFSFLGITFSCNGLASYLITLTFVHCRSLRLIENCNFSSLYLIFISAAHMIPPVRAIRVCLEAITESIVTGFKNACLKPGFHWKWNWFFSFLSLCIGIVFVFMHKVSFSCRLFVCKKVKSSATDFIFLCHGEKTQIGGKKAFNLF